MICWYQSTYSHNSKRHFENERTPESTKIRPVPAFGLPQGKYVPLSLRLTALTESFRRIFQFIRRLAKRNPHPSSYTHQTILKYKICITDRLSAQKIYVKLNSLSPQPIISHRLLSTYASFPSPANPIKICSLRKSEKLTPTQARHADRAQSLAIR